MKRKLRSSKIKRLLDELDWDCQDHLHHKTSLNILHWYPASFITAIPGNIIDIFTEPGDIVWDPFCGSGTSALESVRKGRYFYGNDISETAILITHSKLLLVRYRDKVENEFKRIISEIEQLEFNSSFKISYDGMIEKAKKKCSFNELKPWYSKKTFNDMLILRGFLEDYKHGRQFKPILILLFLSIAKLACAQQKTWGYIADNVLPNQEQISSNSYNVFQGYINKLRQVHEQLRRVIIFNNSASRYQIKMADARNYTPPSKVDIVITSPPYPSMADYITSQRLDYYWLGYSKADIDKFKKQEIGARYLRHNRQKNLMYLDNIRMCFENIIKYINREGLVVLVLPDYNSADPRREVIDSLFTILKSKMELHYCVPRNVDENNRWAPFKSLKKETLSIWSMK